ncbi:MAG TPA: rhomboid family intramembrane serine protease [Terrimicrobiaceae bacterium]
MNSEFALEFYPQGGTFPSCFRAGREVDWSGQMIANRNFEQCEPLTWVGRVPVYLSTVIAFTHGLMMVFTALALASGAEWFFEVFAFSPQSSVSKFYLWQFVTYAFVNRPEIFTLIQLVLLAFFGRDVEKFIGRKGFAWLYAVLVLAIPVLLALLSFVGIQSGSYFGSDAVHFAIFVAFVLIYPGAEIFFGIQARWIAVALVGIYTLQMLAYRQWISLSILWWECGVAALWMMREGVRSFSLPSVPSISPKRPERRSKPTSREPLKEGELYDSIDPILEKIARQGIGSLTRGEREKLERVRAALLEKERRD